MSPRSSLLKRASVPLLAVTAAVLCTPAHAATATLGQYGASGSNTIYEKVNCSMTDDSRWNQALYNAQQLAQNGTYLWYRDTSFEYWGPGDYYRMGYITSSPNPFPSGTYNCWVICSGLKYDNSAWNASTGGTSYLTMP